MDGRLQDLLGDPIQVADDVKKAVEEADSFRHNCIELNSKVENLAILLRSANRLFSQGGGNLYDRPARRILVEVARTLDKVLNLVRRCKKSGMLKRVITIISATDFRKANSLLDNAIGDIIWLLSLYANGDDRPGMEGLPPIASTDPMLAWVWGQIALVQAGTPSEKEEGASYLTSLAGDNDRNRRLIIEEMGVPPLLRLLREGDVGSQLAAANAIGTLAADQECVQQILAQGGIPAFVGVLQDGPMKVQAKVAWAISKMVSRDPDSQTALGGEKIIRSLVSLLVFETIDRDSPKQIKSQSMHSVVQSTMSMNRPQLPSSPPVPERKELWLEMKSNRSDNGWHGDQWSDVDSTRSERLWQWESLPSRRKSGWIDNQSADLAMKSRGGTNRIRHVRGFSDSCFNVPSSRELARKQRENEDPEVKRELKAQVTCALWKLAENNVKNSRRMTDTRALICLAKLVDKDSGEVQRNAVMAIMEIAGAAERDVELRRYAFKASSASAKAVVDQLLRLVKNGEEAELQVPCLKAIGCLARTFPARETQVIEPLVRRLSHKEIIVAAEAATALQKFAHRDNFLHLEHSKTIVDAEAVPLLVRLVGLDDKDVQVPVVILLCHLAMHTGNHDVFRDNAALKALKTVARSNVSHIQSVGEALSSAIQLLELYHHSATNHI